jgi:pimeloyl-ACP methyl ester carboxylesterase
VLALAAVVVIANWTWGRLPTTPAARGRFIALAGERLRYLERPGGEPAVLLLHGQPGTAEDWERVMPLLQGRRTIAIDRPGYGFSTGGYVPLGRQLRAIEELRVRLGLGKPIVVGHSYGGTIALAYAERHPRHLSGLVAVDAGAACTHVSFFERARARFVKFTELPVIAQLATATFSQLMRKASGEAGDDEAFSPGAVDPRHRERLLAINLKHGNLEAYAGEALASNGVIANVNRRLSAIRVPTVVIQGDADKLVKPRCGRELASDIADSRLEMLAGSHMQPYVHPEAVAGAGATVAAEAVAAEAARAGQTAASPGQGATPSGARRKKG